MLSNILDRISFWSLFSVIVLLPIFFIPLTQIPIETSKGLILVVGLVISLIFWIAARLSDGKIVLPKSMFLLSTLVMVFFVFISALFSVSTNNALFGIMFDVGSFYFILGAFLLMLLSSVIFKDIKSVRMIIWGLIFSSSVLFVFQVLHLFMPNILSLGVLGDKIDNIVGSWNTFGIFAGFSTILSLLMIEFFPVSKIGKLFLQIFIILSIVLCVLVNFSLIWGILGVFSLIIFVYKISLSFNKKNEENRSFPFFSFVVVMISLFFFMSGKFVGNLLPSVLGLSNTEVNPSLITTLSVSKESLIKDPIFGIGPNNFSKIWSLYKPQSINLTQFWDSSFNYGFGLLPTLAITTGILGILSWLLFLFMFLSSGIKAIFTSIKNNINWEIVVFFVAAFYLFVVSFFYSVGSVIFLLAFAFSGIFIGLISSSRSSREISFSFLDDPRKSFFSILILVVLMIVSAASGFKYIERFSSVYYFGKTFSAKSVPEAENYIKKAVSLYENDLYLRTYSQVYLTKINSIVSKGASSLSDQDKAELQNSFDQAVNSAQMAVNYDKSNYLNYNLLGSVYNTVGILGVKDAYNNSAEAYKNASVLNPLNPGLKLALARVYFADGKVDDARSNLKQSIDLKPDYLEALISLSQLEKNAGNNNLAINYAENALSFAPDNKDLLQYVSSLKNVNVVSDVNKNETSKIKNNTKKGE